MSVSQDNQKTLLEKIEGHLKIIEDATGLNSKIIMIGLGVSLLFVFIGYFDFYITTIVGIFYPAIWSIRAIESKGSEDDKQWLTYWVVFALFTFIDLFSGFVLKFIPFYFFFKLIFLVWCFMPNTRGAAFIYDKIIIKLFQKYEHQIDQFNEAINERFTTVVKEGQTIVSQNKEKIISTGFKVMEEVHKKTN
jgi:receptor expression-enhancing protein 5/6